MEISQRLLNERIQFLYNRNYSENTIQNYTLDLKLFVNFLKIENKVFSVSMENITQKNIESRKTYLANVKTPKNSIYYQKKSTISPATIQSKITAIKSFLKFMNLIYEMGIDYRKIETKRIKSDYIECINDTEFWELMDYVEKTEKYKINALRSELLINIGYTSWLRLSEILSLKVGEIEKGETRIIGKGNKARWVFFTPSTKNILERYIIERENPIPRTGKVERKSDFAFISHNSWYDFWNPIRKNTICEIMKRYSDGLNIGKRITVHCLRHSYATKLLESGMNIREIQELLWHCDIQTTENYCHVLKSNLKEKVNKIFI